MGKVREPVEILYKDKHYVAINKPPGMLVHRTSQTNNEQRFAVQQVRNQIGQWVYPVHRLDGPTSGILVFGLSSKAAALMVENFRRRTIEKYYLMVVRGHAKSYGTIDIPLRKEPEYAAKTAITQYKRFATAILPHPVGKYPQAYYSLVEAKPLTGRMHQLRRHFKIVYHPILGDFRYGDYNHNALLRDKFGINNMFLHARKFAFPHPYTKKIVTLEAPPAAHFYKLFDLLGWNEVNIQQPFDFPEEDIDEESKAANNTAVPTTSSDLKLPKKNSPKEEQ